MSTEQRLRPTGRTAAPTDSELRLAHQLPERVLAEIVGQSLRWATAQITKITRSTITDEQLHDVSDHEA